MDDQSKNPQQWEKFVDVRKGLADQSQKVSLHSLAKKGITNVKVINEEKIQQLIIQAINHVLTRTSTRLSDKELVRIAHESKEELDRLLKDRQEQELARQSSESSRQEMQREAERLKELLKKQYGVLQQVAKDLKDKTEEVATLKGKMAAFESQDRGPDWSQLQEALDRGSEETKGEMRGLMAQLAEQLKAKDRELLEMKEKIDARGKISQTQDWSSVQQFVEKGSADTKKEVRSLLEGFLSEFSERIVLSGAGQTRDSIVRSAEVVLDNLFNETLESNIKKVQVKQASAGGIDDSLEKLKRLRNSADNARAGGNAPGAGPPPQNAPSQPTDKQEEK